MGVQLPPFAPSPVWRLQLGALTLLAAAIRAAWALWPEPLHGDAIEYWQLATMLATRGRYSYDGLTAASSRPPLYSGLIAVLMRLTSHPHAALIALQILFGSLTVALTASLAHRAFGHRVAVIAGIGLAIAPMSAHFTAAVLSETLFTLFIVLSMWLWQDERPIAAGVALGLSALTRLVSAPFILILAIVGLLFRKTTVQRQCLPIALAALLTTAPWIARNVVQARNVTIADGSWGTTLAYGSVRLHSGSNRYTQIARALQFAPASNVTSTGSEGQDAAFALFLQRLTTDPAGWIRARASQYPWLIIDSGDYVPARANATPFFRAWQERRFAPIILKLSFVASNVLVLALALYGAWSARARARELLPLWLLPAFVLTAQLPTYVEPRFGLPIVPFVVIFAAAGLARISVYAGEIPR